MRQPPRMAVCWGLQNSHHLAVLLCLSQRPRKEGQKHLLSTLFVALLLLLLHWQLEQKLGLPSVFIPFILVPMPVLTLTSSFTSVDQTCLLIPEVEKLNFDYTVEKTCTSSFYVVSLLSPTTVIQLRTGPEWSRLQDKSCSCLLLASA